MKSLSLKNLFKLSFVALRNPIFSVLTVFASAKTYALSQKLFPITHETDGIGNAFRHALWNCLIMMYCCKVSSPEKSLNWTIKITNFHEDLFRNKPLEKAMDLHNNEVGRNYFMKLLPTIHRQFFETSFFIDGLLDKTRSAKVLKILEQNLDENLVYLEK